MLSDEVLEKVIDRVVRRIELGNTYVLTQIGKTINKIGTLTPTRAYQLEQILKYGGDYDKIVKELAKMTNLNVADIYKIFDEVAKNDYQFAKKFYDYRNKAFIPYKDNLTLQNEVKAIARQTALSYVNMSNTFAFKTLRNGKYVNTPLATLYQDVIDKAILSVSQGKMTFDDEMYQTIKELSASGLKTIDYDSDRAIRLDSAVKMNLKEGLRTLHNQIQEITGEEFGADGVEISVHSMPAIDHEEVQGRQFSKNKYDKDGNLIEKGEYEKLQETGIATTYDGKKIDLHIELKNGEQAKSFRPISTLNCYHYIFAIILGVSEPEYTDKELEKIKQDNDKGFEYDGKHYTLYEGTQLQRNLESELRKAKDEQIMGRASDIMENVEKAQKRITILTNKYKELIDVSGLPSKLDRARVPGYRRINTKKIK